MNIKAIAIKVPFHAAAMGEEEVRAVSEVIRSGWLTMGAKTFEFEREFARYVGAKYAVAVSSCTAALHLCLEAVGIREQDEVLVPTTTFTATAEVVTYLGARPVFVDVDPQTLNLDVSDARRKITDHTRAIIPVHFGGQPCDLAEIQELAQSCKLHVVEDAAHALPSSYCGKRIGTTSELTAFSFYATKTLSTGEGGMVTTDNEGYAHRLQLMRLHGISRDAWKRYSAEGSWRYEVIEAGYKYNLTDIQAALGIVQLSKCDAMDEARRCIAERYTRELSSVEALKVPEILPDRTTSWHLYVLRLRLAHIRIDRDTFIRELADRGVSASVHFIPLHLQPYYQRAFNYKEGDFPVAEREYRRCLSLPIYPTMTDEEVEHVIWSVRDVVGCWAK
jgi:dTDP-4-amino-4,6-dideoxygalactose transaminase